MSELINSKHKDFNIFLCVSGSLNSKMKEKRKEKAVISTVGDILLQRVCC